MLNNRHLEYFLAVVEAGSFTRAAEALHISQPALSKQIGELERQLGTPLFRRSGRRAELTAAGQVLVKEGKRYLALEKSLCRKVREAARSEAAAPTPLLLGYTGAIEVFGLSALVQRFHARYPAYVLDIHRMGQEELISALLTGQLDAGLLVTDGRGGGPELEYRNLYEDRLCIIAGRGCASDCPGALDLVSAAAAPLIRCTGEPAVWSAFLTRCGEVGVTPNVVAEQRLPETVLLMVRSGLGVTVLSEQVIIPPDLRVVPVEGMPSVFLSLLWRRGAVHPGLPLLAELAVENRWRAE